MTRHDADDNTAAIRRMDREAIRTGGFVDIMREGERLGLFTLTTEEERRRSMTDMLAGRPATARDDGLWVFGYGSLMWNPGMKVIERRLGRIHGWHRCYRISAPIGRGMPDAPGLTLCLDAGGSATGMALRLDPESEREELEILWDREMVTGAYRPRWVTARTAAGPVPAITFVADRSNPRYVGQQSDDTMVETLATAAGCLGSTHDYLKQTIRALEDHGFRATALHALERRVSRFKAAQEEEQANGG